jgi:predicted HNH restriction endonuclease
VAVSKAKKRKIDKRKYSDRKEYLIKAVQKRRIKVRTKAIEYKGGKCEKCGYNKCNNALEFHHLDPKIKEFGISEKGYTRSWKSIEKELNCCQLLCANCHREVHAEIAAFPSNRD